MPRDDTGISPDDQPDDDKPGAPTPEAVGDAARQAIMDAIGILDRKGTPIANLIALQAMKRPDLLLKAMGRFAPSRTANDLQTTVQALHLAALRALAAAQVSQPPPMLDVTPTSNNVAKDDWLS